MDTNYGTPRLVHTTTQPSGISRRLGVGLLPLCTILALLAGCTVGTPGLPRVWPGQSISPNIQARAGDIVELTLLATNDSTNPENGNASQVRTFTALPAGVEVIGFSASDDKKLPADDQWRTWLEQIDTKNNVVVVGFNKVESGELKTATLRLRVTAAAGTTLTFRTMIAWSNDAPDQMECDAQCVGEGLSYATADDPQLRAYVAEHPAEVSAFMETYQGGGKAVANTVSIAVGDAPIHSTFPVSALMASTQAASGVTFTTQGIFTPGEPVILWYNQPGNAAVHLFRTDAFDDGSIICGLSEEQWQQIPQNATSIVAHGQFSKAEAVYLFNR